LKGQPNLPMMYCVFDNVQDVLIAVMDSHIQR
jgi:hypothetical protein